MEVIFLHTYFLSLWNLMEMDFLFCLENDYLRSFKGVNHAAYLEARKYRCSEEEL